MTSVTSLTFDILAVDLAGTTIAWKNDGAKMDQRICAYLEVMLYLQVLCYIVLEIKAIKQLGWHTYRKQYISLLTCINLLSKYPYSCQRPISVTLGTRLITRIVDTMI